MKEGWNIGCDVILYRCFKDGIGAHADDTQGETAIFCVIIASEAVANSDHDIRALNVLVKTPAKAKKKEKAKEDTSEEQDENKQVNHLADGDEEFEILAGWGDAYEMDGMFVTAFWNVLVLLQYTCWYLARETT